MKGIRKLKQGASDRAAWWLMIFTGLLTLATFITALVLSKTDETLRRS